MARVGRGTETLPPAAPQPQLRLGRRRANWAKQRFDLEERDTLDTPLPSQPLRKPVAGPPA